MRRRPGARVGSPREPWRVGADAHEQRRIGDRPRHEADHAQPVPVLGARPERNQVARGLEPDEAAVGGREPDRAGAVRCAGGRAQPGRDRGGAAAARAGRASVRVPGVAGDPERGPLGVAHDRQLGQVRLPEDHGAGGAQAAHQLSVAGGRGDVRGRAPGRDLPRDVLRVLDRDRDAEELPPPVVAAGGPACVRLPGVGERALAQHAAKGVQLGIEPLDPLQVQLGELRRGDLTGSDQLGLAHDAGECKLLPVHGVENLRERSGTPGEVAKLVASCSRRSRQLSQLPESRTTKMCSTSPRYRPNIVSSSGRYIARAGPQRPSRKPASRSVETAVSRSVPTRTPR